MYLQNNVEYVYMYVGTTNQFSKQRIGVNTISSQTSHDFLKSKTEKTLVVLYFF